MAQKHDEDSETKSLQVFVNSTRKGGGGEERDLEDSFNVNREVKTPKA